MYVKYSESSAPLVEGCVDSEGEEAGPSTPRRDPVIHWDTDTITICDTRVRLRLCPARQETDNKESQFVPVKRKDLFKLLGLNESSDILDPSEEADAKKVALQNFLSSAVDKELFNNNHINADSPVSSKSEISLLNISLRMIKRPRGTVFS